LPKHSYKTIGYSQLKDYGINPLTGEACAFSMRILCDLSEKGIELLQDFYGLLPDTINHQFPRNMNSRVGEDKAIASCMISRGVFKDLYQFILFKECWELILDGTCELTGMSKETYNEIKDAWPKDTKVIINYKSAGQPSVGSRNVHAMTGRVL